MITTSSLTISAVTKFGFPIVFDATHSVQSPGGQGDKSGGDRKFVPTLAKAAVSAGIAGVFIETHPNPKKSPSDGQTMIPLSNMNSTLKQLVRVFNSVH